MLFTLDERIEHVRKHIAKYDRPDNTEPMKRYIADQKALLDKLLAEKQAKQCS